MCRQVIIGAGRVGLGPQGDKPGFQVSQRADYIEQEISLETTLNRGIINTRDEPHTDADHWGRLHVIIGDANMSQTANFLKFGMTSLVLDAIEAGVDFSELKLKNAVSEVAKVSHDLSLTHQLRLADGSELTAIDILRRYLDKVQPFAETPVEQRVTALWGEVLGLLENDLLSTSHLLDWTAKLALIKSFEARGLSINDPKMYLIDLQYSDIDPQKSLYHALVSKGRMKTLCSAQDIADAAATPPQDSRAYFRGRVMDKFGESVLAANWESLIVATSSAKEYRVHTSGLDTLTREEAGELVEKSATIDELIEGLEKENLTPLTAIQAI